MISEQNTAYNNVHGTSQPKFSTLYQSNKQYLYKIYKSLFTLKQTDPQPNVFIDDDTMKEFVRNDLRLMFQDEQMATEQRDNEEKGNEESGIEEKTDEQTPTTTTSEQIPEQKRTLEQLTNVLQLNIFKMQFISPFTKNILIIGTNHLFNIRILTKFVSKEQEKIIQYLQEHSANNHSANNHTADNHSANNHSTSNNNCEQK